MRNTDYLEEILTWGVRLGGLGNPATGDDYAKGKIAIAEVSEVGYFKFLIHKHLSLIP